MVNRTLNERLYCVLGYVFYTFCAVLAFSSKVFLYIPVARGGGSYVDSPKVSLRFRSTEGGDVIFKGLAQNDNLVLIGQTPRSVFLADMTKAG